MTHYHLPVILLFLFTSSHVATAQNHVPNASFEDHTGCPNSFAQINYCNQWVHVVGSPDYYHACGSGDYGVPNNGYTPNGYIGYQMPVQGDAYVGFMPYNPSHFEYISVPILPLTPGQRYEVSMSVNLANWSTVATDNIGVFFYDKGFKSIPWNNSSLFMEMLPQVHYRSLGIIKDSANWVRLTKEYMPDSAYSRIMIGGFNDSTGSYSKDTVGTIISYGVAYYYIDSVVIRPILPTSTVEMQTIEGLGLYPNPNNGSFTLKGNVQTGGNLHITVLNMIGQLVYSHTTKPSEGILYEEIQLDGIAKGIYLLRVANASGNVSNMKFIVE